MGGPIVRTGATPEFWNNWDRIFNGDSKAKKKTSPKKKTPTAKRSKKKKAKK